MCIELEHVQHRKNGREEIFQRRQKTLYCSIQLVRVERRKRRFSKGDKKEEMGNQWPPSSTLGSEIAAKIQIHTHIQVMKANTHAYAYIDQNCRNAYRMNQFLPMGEQLKDLDKCGDIRFFCLTALDWPHQSINSEYCADVTS